MDEQKRLKHIRHVAENKGEKIMSWRRETSADPTKSDPSRFRITLDADASLESAAFKAFEKKLASNNITVMTKFSTRFGKGLIVTGNGDVIVALKQSDDHIVDVISPAPVAQLLESAKTWAQSADSMNEPCTPDQAKRQIAIADTVRGMTPADRTNFGQGAIIIVWDQPYDNEDWDEFKKRRGGAPMITRMAATPGNHGSMVTSTCCGTAFGLASGAELGLLGMDDTVDLQLAFIDKVVDAELAKPAADRKAIVVNMSFKYTFNKWTRSNTSDKTGMAGAREDTQRWRDNMEAMKAEYPRLVFVNASGNDGMDVCEMDYDDSMGYDWPSFGHGKGYALGEEPFVRIGAAVAKNAEIPAARDMASYSNRGKCVHAYTYGNVCAFDAQKGGFFTTMGTSFAAPMFSSLVALVMTKNKTMSGDEAIRVVVEQGRDKMGDGNFVSIDPSLLALDQPVSGTTETKPSLVAANDAVDAGADALEAPPVTTNMQLVYVACGVAAVGGAYLLYRELNKNKKRA